ncbi:LysR substrate-binding domain-containing protein [Lacrimispora sp. 38-1]|uniref:LysR substrate-binding domain-containing protein n=1 Tax=Lacrimispora sp. 38-1 TaxID=3125778 RepID=UPI003CF95D93
MEIRQLQYFLTVCETLHFGKAAEQLHMAQQPLSFQIHKLEEELGYKLFYRTTRSVSITPSGIELRDKTIKALSYLKQGVETGKLIADGKIGKLRIAYNSMIISTSVTEILSAFKEKYPQVELILEEMNSPDLENSVSNQEVDVGIAGLIWKSYDDLNYQLIATENSSIAIPKNWDLANQDISSLSELKDQPFITYSQSSKWKSYGDFMSVCHLAGFTPNVVQDAETDISVLGLVASGLGIALVPNCYTNILNDTICYKPLKNPEVHIDISLVWNNENICPMAQNFIDLAGEYKNLPVSINVSDCS